jgi:ketosteroid isomerase-like protein
MTLDDLRAEAEIRNLAYGFADAVNRADVAAFSALWAPEGTWVIDPPMDVAAQGRENLQALFTRLMGSWTFFHQVPNQGPVFVEGDTAHARLYMHEIGIFRDGRTHRNWSEYADTYRRVDGNWLYVRRHYHFLYVDGPPMHPDILGVAVDS